MYSTPFFCGYKLRDFWLSFFSVPSVLEGYLDVAVDQNWYNSNCCSAARSSTRSPHRPSIFCDRPAMQRRQKSDDDNLEAGDQAAAGDPPGDHADKNKKAGEQPLPADSWSIKDASLRMTPSKAPSLRLSISQV